MHEPTTGRSDDSLSRSGANRAGRKVRFAQLVVQGAAGTDGEEHIKEEWAGGREKVPRETVQTPRQSGRLTGKGQTKEKVWRAKSEKQTGGKKNNLK